MGKSLFLGLLEDFLGVVSDTPYRDRRTRYEQYAIHEEDLKFFEDNIARHPVFKLDLKAFSLLLGLDAVVVIDECDAPFINTLCDVKDRDLRFQLFGVYGSFLSGILKGNPYLYKGVLAGVFDVLRSGVGSGLNNSVTFLAHSGFVDRQTNPFERAFGFTAPDVQGAINRYVNKLWPGRGGCPNVDEFKARVFSGLLAQCGGYRTGRLTMFRPIKEGSLEDLQRYLSHLTAAFHRQQEFQRTSPAMVRLETASSLDDGAVVQIASQPSEQNELAYGDDTEAQL
ncbi:hypothetical protein IWQ57_003679, partial [Coemansia nantahalensis]